ncbi:hypothetical protein D9758_018009 [Tetrapyrgos nigripes]|uniref:AB hydrolase-1 domain-containing protein n=1 Tax=Tetrapyrgos nigripes TaxID=182062 RepID=A0A8H5C982_9AGAR|nr:hypothetical protein D9758_018009 [Tetrapyrgos nigripes]
MAHRSGTVEFVVGDQKLETWYLITGDLKNSKKTPVVILHGGPVMNYIYLKYVLTQFHFPLQQLNPPDRSHEKLSDEAGIPVVFYNQIGFKKYPDIPVSFWTRELFFDELDNLVEKLGIKDNFGVYGHSWGGVMGSEYAATRSPPGLKKLVLANTFASSPLYNQCKEDWIDKLPGNLPQIIRKHKADGTTNAQEYKDAVQVYKNLHICTLTPWPDELLDSLAHSRGNLPPGVDLIPDDWDVVDKLPNIQCPTLVISSPKDDMAELCVRPFFQKIEKCKWVDLQVASHVPFFEEPERYFSVLQDFLDATDK